MSVNRKWIDPKSFFQFLPNFYSFADCDMIQRAWQLADKRFDGLVSRDGTPFVYDCRQVASFLIHDHADDAAIVVSGLLNCVLEETNTKEEEIREAFGSDVVAILRKISEIRRLSGEKMSHEEKLQFLKGEDRRAVWVFLADRFEHAAGLRQYIPGETWDVEREEDLLLYIPLAKHFSLNILADSLQLLQPDFCQNEEKDPILHLVPRELEFPKELSEACSHFEKAEELFHDDHYAEAEQEYDTAVKLCLPRYATLRLRIQALEGLARCIRKQRRDDIRAVSIYLEILDLTKTYRQKNPKRYWLETCLISERLGRCYMDLRRFTDAKEALLSGVSACEHYLYISQQSSPEVVSCVYFSLGVFYSFDDNTLQESEAVMLRVRNARQELCRQNTSEGNLMNLKVVLTALIDLRTWMGKPTDDYEMEMEVIEKRLELIRSNKKD